MKKLKINSISLTEKEEKIAINALEYVNEFLSEMHSFYPFAMLMDKNNNIFSLAPDIENEYPSDGYLIELYKRGIYNQYSISDIYILEIICSDILIKKKENYCKAISIEIIAPDYIKKTMIDYIILLKLKDGTTKIRYLNR